MPYYVLIQSSNKPAVANGYLYYPSSAELEPLRSIQGAVGRPRIVRVNEQGNLVTYVTLLVSVQDLSRSINAAVERLYAALPDASSLPGYRKSDYWEAMALAYDPADNGSVDWWTRFAHQTRTRDATFSDRLAFEDPASPDAARTGSTPGTSTLPAELRNPAPNFRAFEIVERTFLQDNAPSYEEIAQLFEVPKPPGVVWLGGSTRVTRFVGGGTGLQNNVTRAVRVAYFPDASLADMQAEIIREALEVAIAGSRGASYTFDDVRVLPLDVRFGRPAFWVSGEANRSQTWQRFSLLTNDENPYGPNDPRVRPTNMAEWAGETLPQVGNNILWPIALAVGAVTVVYLFGPAIRASSQATASSIESRSRSNPTRRRRRRQSTQRSRR